MTVTVRPEIRGAVRQAFAGLLRMADNQPRDRRGRWKKGAGQLASELDDMLAKFDALAAEVNDDDDDDWDIGEIREKLASLRDRKKEKTKRREAIMETASSGDVEVSIHRDGDVGVDAPEVSFYMPPAAAKELVSAIDRMRKLPVSKDNDGSILDTYDNEDVELSVFMSNDGSFQIGPTDSLDEDEGDGSNVLYLGYDEAADFADLLEELADRSLEGTAS